ncbi:MAG: cation transporter [Lachnospiraceae bacterium]|nr:cation transporter [Lachnospiraceae bacterium]
MENNREKIVVRTSIIGILVNVLLASFKAVIGLLSHSIAIVLDAVNNISDAASSVITIIGTKLAGKAPDKKHPFGHGRVEYLTTMVISVLVLYAGLTSLVESVKKIVQPETPEYTSVTLLIVAVAVVAKILLGQYVKSVGKKVHSDSLVNSGEDARLDAVISAATLVAAVLYLAFGLKLEAWLGAVISLIIIKSGIDMLRDIISQILGERIEPSLAKDIKDTIRSFPDVSGVYDLVLNNYGPDTYNGSVHVSVPDTYSANDLDDLLRSIAEKVYEKHHIILTAIGVYSVNTKDPKTIEIRTAVTKAVREVPYIREIHGFYLYEEQKILRFDLVVSFDSPDRKKTYEEAIAKVQALYPDYEIHATMDTDFSEED